MKFRASFKKIFRDWKILSLLIVIVGGLIILFVSFWDNEILYDFAVAERRDVVQKVEVTGTVKPASNVDLAFDRSGKIARVYLKVGDKVSAGQVLVTLQNGDLVSQLHQAEAQLIAEEANLSEVQSNPEAEQSLRNSYDGVITKLDDAFAKTDDAVRAKTIGMFASQKMAIDYYELTYAPCASDVVDKIVRLYPTVQYDLVQWREELDKLSPASSREEIDEALKKGQIHLALAKQFIDGLNNTLFIVGCTNSNSSLDTYRMNISTARTNILTAMSNLNGLQQTIASQKVTFNNADAVKAADARVAAARANVENYRSQLEKTVIRSPIDGAVAKEDAKVGQIALANTPLVSVISRAKFEIEANVPEADIAKLTIGNRARITLDAYGEDVLFEAVLVKIDQVETVIEGVSTYKTTFQFNVDDERLKSGMTANITIETAKKERVIVIPERSVINKGSDRIVRVLDPKEETREVKVTTGLRDSEGNIEIIAGLNEGDKVVTSLLNQ